MLGKQERACFENENAFRSAAAAEPQMFGDGGTERTAANDDEVERPHFAVLLQWIAVYVPRVGAIGRIGIGKRFLERIAHIAPEHIEREVGRL